MHNYLLQSLQGPTAVEYYPEAMFAAKTALDKYRCIHCNKIPKVFYRCECGRVDKSEVGKGKPRYENNTGLSCGDCKHLPCTQCNRSDRYELDRTTNTNVRRLKIHCQQGCGETLNLQELGNHLKNKCSKRRRPCKYNCIGCKEENAGQELEAHENNASKHFDLAMLVIFDLQKRVELLEKAGSSTQQISTAQPPTTISPPSTPGPTIMYM